MATLGAVYQPAIEKFGLDGTRGFLPSADPLPRLSAHYAAWEQVAAEIPKLLVANRLRTALLDLPMLDTAELQSSAEFERAMLLLSYLGHAYVFGDLEPDAHLPSAIAVPWAAVASRVGRPPILSYASHALVNWRRYDCCKPVALGNIARLQNFGGGLDEDWFVLVHVGIEAAAAPALDGALEARSAVLSGDTAVLTRALGKIAATIRGMLAILRRMPEKCDPYIYYTRVRQFIFGWLDNPGLPDGVFYHGVNEYSGMPQKFRGETGAQSSIIPALDAACGINYSNDPLASHLKELRSYMPPAHRLFIEHLESGPSVYLYVLGRRESALIDAYNSCIEALRDFRLQHLEYAGLYIHAQSQRNKANPTSIGTGGTPFMQYLKTHCESLDQYFVTNRIGY
jgi:indoleamine 2,3-dioxygenase